MIRRTKGGSGVGGVAVVCGCHEMEGGSIEGGGGGSGGKG